MKEKTLLLTGSGALENAWKPVQSAISQYSSFKNLESSYCNDFFASLVYSARATHEIKNKHPKGQLEGKNPVDALNEFKKILRYELKNYQEKGEVVLRPEFDKIIEHIIIIPYEINFNLLTTNWNTCEEVALNKYPFFNDRRFLNLHGEFSKREQCTPFMLPAETSFEPYFEDQSLKSDLSSFNFFRDEIREATRIFIYGLSFSPLDAELAAIFSTGDVHSSTKYIDIVDCHPERVIQRLKLFIKNHEHISFRSAKPEQVNQLNQIFI